jgi:hypothetical protein
MRYSMRPGCLIRVHSAATYNKAPRFAGGWHALNTYHETILCVYYQPGGLLAKKAKRMWYVCACCASAWALHANNMHAQPWRYLSHAAVALQQYIYTRKPLASLTTALPKHCMLFGHVMYTYCVRSCAQARLSSNCSAASASTAPLTKHPLQFNAPAAASCERMFCTHATYTAAATHPAITSTTTFNNTPLHTPQHASKPAAAQCNDAPLQ